LLWTSQFTISLFLGNFQTTQTREDELLHGFAVIVVSICSTGRTGAESLKLAKENKRSHAFMNSEISTGTQSLQTISTWEGFVRHGEKIGQNCDHDYKTKDSVNWQVYSIFALHNISAWYYLLN
jgi:hypothetical protein